MKANTAEHTTVEGGGKMANFICVRHEQIKSARACNGHGKHNNDLDFRKNLTNVNSDKSKENIHIAFNGYNDEISVYENFKLMRDNYQQTKGKKLRSDAVQCIETVYTASPEVFKNEDGSRSVESERAFMRACIATEKQFFGDCPFIIDLHVDEKTAHIHALAIPYDSTGKAYNREISNIKAYRGIQDKFAENCRIQGLDVVRGVSSGSSGNKHVEPPIWKAEEEELKKAHDAKMKQIQQDKERQLLQIETNAREEIQQAYDDWELIKKYEEQKAKEKHSQVFDNQSLDKVISGYEDIGGR